MVLSKKNTGVTVWVSSWTSPFLMEHHFYLPDRQTLIVQTWVCGSKIWVLKPKLEFWNTCIQYYELANTYRWDQRCYYQMWFFKYSILKWVNIWKNCITQLTNIFQMTDAWCYKIHSECKMNHWILMQWFLKFIDRISDSSLQRAFKKLPFCSSIIEECLQLFEKSMKILLYFTTTCLCEARFSSYSLNQSNILPQAESRGR